MREPIELKPSDVRAIINATFPEYRRKKVWVYVAETVTLHDLNWCGGTRMQYRGATLNGQFAGSADKHNAVAPWENRAEGATIPIPQGHVVVSCGHFCGKPSMLSIYVHPADMPKLLPNMNAAQAATPKGWDQVEA
jgi:hypothetical protein